MEAQEKRRKQGKVKKIKRSGKNKPTDSVNHKTLEYELERRYWFCIQYT